MKRSGFKQLRIWIPLLLLIIMGTAIILIRRSTTWASDSFGVPDAAMLAKAVVAPALIPALPTLTFDEIQRVGALPEVPPLGDRRTPFTEGAPSPSPEAFSPAAPASEISPVRTTTSGTVSLSEDEICQKARVEFRAGRLSAKELLALFMPLAKKGHPDAMDGIGTLYLRGDAVEKNEVEARRWLAKAAEAGHIKAMCGLGYLYYKGKGGEKDYAKANAWTLRSAEGGYADAAFNMGLFYMHGAGVNKDLAIAREWYEKSARLGNLNGMTNYGVYLIDGIGGKMNKAEGLRWLHCAAARGSEPAAYSLGQNYRLGETITKDLNEAARWYAVAARKGNKKALTQLKALLGTSDAWKSLPLPAVMVEAEAGRLPSLP